MAALLKLGSPQEASELVEALHVAADARDNTAPELATRWRRIANDIGDALDALPRPRHDH